MIKKLSIIMTLLTTLVGCASIVNGVNQPISVNTGSVYGATCKLENNKGTWYINNTPGSTMVHRSYHDLNIQCQKPGYKSGYKNDASQTLGRINSLLRELKEVLTTQTDPASAEVFLNRLNTGNTIELVFKQQISLESIVNVPALNFKK